MCLSFFVPLHIVTNPLILFIMETTTSRQSTSVRALVESRQAVYDTLNDAWSWQSLRVPLQTYCFLWAGLNHRIVRNYNDMKLWIYESLVNLFSHTGIMSIRNWATDASYIIDTVFGVGDEIALDLANEKNLK